MSFKVIVVLTVLATAFAAPKPRIYGGENAGQGEFPYQISYQYGLLDNELEHVCGGSILNENWILTAGHCVTEVPTIGVFKVVAGITQLDATDGQAINVDKKIVHPDFAGNVAPNDVALLHLETPLTLNDAVQPVKLPEAGSEPSGNVILSGWGSVGQIIIFPIMPNDLQKVELPIISGDDCKKALDDILADSGEDNPFDAASNTCTGPLTGGIGACNGDSGGPLAIDGTVVGIVSWGINPCGTEGAPSVYTKVSNFLDFINDNISA